MTEAIPHRVCERVLSKVVLDEAHPGCLISTYSLGSHGYAQIGWKGESGRYQCTTVHRAAWTYHNGAIPKEYTVDHLCKVRTCVQISHLRLLTNFENARRTFGRNWALGQCRNGHPNRELVLSDGGRRIRCRLCRAEYQRRYRAKRARLRAA